VTIGNTQSLKIFACILSLSACAFLREKSLLYMAWN